MVNSSPRECKTKRSTSGCLHRLLAGQLARHGSGDDHPTDDFRIATKIARARSDPAHDHKMFPVFS
jgi:hypothetical protein